METEPMQPTPPRADNETSKPCAKGGESGAAAQERQRRSQQRHGVRLDPRLLLQLEMAAKGCVSGTLKEWPMLNAALEAIGYKLAPMTPAWVLRNLTRQAVSSHTVKLTDRT